MEQTDSATKSIIQQTAKERMPVNIRKSPSQQLLHKIKEQSKLAKRSLKENNIRIAIAHYEEALLAAYDLYKANPKHDRILKIREKIADLYTLNGSHEDALLLYSCVKDGYFTTKGNVRRVKVLEEKEIVAMYQVACNREQKNTEHIDQLYELSLVNIQIGNYRRAQSLLQRVLNEVRIRDGVTNDQVLIIREHLGDLHASQLKIEEARVIYCSILKTMAEREESPNWELYAAVKQKLEDLVIP
uniref:Uncharacterized protein n=1 Tax=Leptocylindrus danicus TaxID=163516 RepID=A0A7S2LFV6_9STRA|mmetsp:Transcript_4570/g.6685  ORF Transcript_4570/g.6685 Transcript_4570/m.6685 type:complete len:244 (+) Transcript_4570:94-825(+)